MSLSPERSSSNTLNDISDDVKQFSESDILLTDENPTLKYRRRKDEEKTAVAYGQRKLLLMLTQFLNYFLDLEKTPNPVCIYSGAAQGTNIGIVATLFPEIEWHLYDPMKFKLKKTSKIHIYQEYFTDDTARSWADKEVYFVSDIRTADYTKAKNLDENERQIMKDMEMQRNWVKIMRPIKSSLKFRLPYTGGNRPEKLRYFDGWVLLGIFSPQTSTETRLIPYEDYPEKIWDCRKYQNQMFYHNVITREKATFLNPFDNSTNPPDPPELLNDWDSMGEVRIWMDYLKWRNAEPNRQNVVALSRLATARLTNGRKYADTLAYLRANPRAIKNRNFNRTRDDRKPSDFRKIKQEIKKYSKWLSQEIL